MSSSYLYDQPLQKILRNKAKEKHILIVDDQETVLFFLKDRLEELGFVVSQASNGKDGINILRQYSCHGVLLDLEMPGMDGLTILRQLQKDTNEVPVIIMSADPTRTAMLTSIEAGAKDYLTKPISPVILKYKCLRLFL